MLVCSVNLPSELRADDPENCNLCHQYRGLARYDAEADRVHLFFTDTDYSHYRKGPHALLACTDCHERQQVGVIPHLEVSRVNCARQCHLSGSTGLERLYSHATIAKMLDRSVHPAATLERVEPTGGPMLSEGQSICLYCHDEPLFSDPSQVIPKFTELAERVYDRCDVCHVQDVPVDIEYYVRHIASRLQPARPTLEIAQVCAVCHTDDRVLQEFGMKDSVASFIRSFHGKAALLGDESTANCLSCHVTAGENVHLMLGHKNPLSSIHPKNAADSCRACHREADVTIAEAAVHLDLPTAHGSFEFALAMVFILLTIWTFAPSAFLVALDLVQVFVGRTHSEDKRREELARTVLQLPEGKSLLTRFNIKQRIEHWILAILFVTLVVTGFPLKFADQAWAAFLVRLFGGLHITRNVHHWAGIALVVGFMWHLLGVLVHFRRRTRSLREQGVRSPRREAWLTLPMWITWSDVRKAFQLLSYLLFLRNDRPRFGRFSPTEKFEYLGVFWGTVLLGVTGMLLWGEQISSRFLSGRAFNIAAIVHTFEAFLAVIHVGILHVYNVVLAPRVFPLSLATITGATPIDKLAEEHGELIDAAADRLGIRPEGETQ